jgi:hypothetical protein
MVYQRQNVFLMRDMTDTMYNSRMAPHVHHCTGTDLVIEHIEKNWCPTITSVDFLGGAEFRFAEDKRPHVVFVVGEDEYETEATLPAFSAKHLGKEFRTAFVFGSETERNDFPGVEAVRDADLLVVSVRRRAPRAAQLKLIREFVTAGKPVVGIRTACHAFSLRNSDPPPPGHAVWDTFDPDVFGGHYTGHHGPGPKTEVTVVPEEAKHAILTGVDVTGLVIYFSVGVVVLRGTLL